MRWWVAFLGVLFCGHSKCWVVGFWLVFGGVLELVELVGGVVEVHTSLKCIENNIHIHQTPYIRGFWRKVV
jgi:hypothetical protein